jgi:predicted dehydrogenase
MARSEEGVTRRGFLRAGGVAAAASLLPGRFAIARTAPAKRRYAIVGTGGRGSSMWGSSVLERHGDAVELVGLCDVNRKRAEIVKGRLKTNAEVFTDFDAMCDRVKPELIAVTTVDATHAGYVVRAFDRGIDVITEKPMVTDEQQCRAILDAEKKTGRKLTVAFNYRYAPKHVTIKETLMSGAIGKITSVDFNWYLDVYHGADYFRRWHRLRKNSGSLLVHKASHHFDLVNWWLDSGPEKVSAFGSLQHYGRNGEFRHTNCRGCPHRDRCRFFWDMTKDAGSMELYAACESEDGYLRDGCVFREDVDIFDTMNLAVRYRSGVQMSYSLNACMPIEGYRIAFDGTLGRLEVRDYERQPWKPDQETEIWLTRSFGERTAVTVPPAVGAHGGGDDVLRALVFAPTPVADHLKLPDSRAGARSCLTGIAARHSIDDGREIAIDDLVPGI